MRGAGGEGVDHHGIDSVYRGTVCRGCGVRPPIVIEWVWPAGGVA